MAFEDIDHGLPQRIHVQFAGQAEDCGDVVGGARRVEAVDEPHPLLANDNGCAQDADRQR